MIFCRFTCVWLVIFLFSAIGPAATTNWLSDVLVPTFVSAPDQPGEHIADTPQLFEAETEFNKEIFLISPVLCVINRPEISVEFTVQLVPCRPSYREYRQAPSCPRPPPVFLS
nr:hypothetical protein [uncultured Desulfuromonas sp.]